MLTKWTLTQEMIDWMRSLIGVELPPREVFFNTQATRDAIRRFADGIADFNPLWRDEEYARRTRYGRIVAPPNFLWSVYFPAGGQFNIGNFLGYTGKAVFGGNDLELYLPILEGDSFTYTEKIVGVVEKETRAWGLAYRVDSEVTFRNQRDEVVGKARGWTFRANPDASPHQRRRPIHQYTQEELRQIIQESQEESPRGAIPRYWEDVQVGEELPPLVRGPLHIQDLLAFLVGAGDGPLPANFLGHVDKVPDWSRSHGRAVEYVVKRSEMTVEPEVVEYPSPAMALHHTHPDIAGSQEGGIGNPYEFGPQRLCWLTMLLTHWQGDEGFLKRLYCELREINQLGDTTWLKGKVAGKELEGGEHLVEIECWCENQLGAVTARGHATVVLPSRAA